MPGFPAGHMDVRMAKYSKSKNSTKRPSVSEHEQWPLFTCNLKENTGLLYPVIRVHASDWDFDSDGSQKGYTYAYLPRWQRYYFVVDARLVEGDIWEVQLAVDPLASFRTEIGNYSGLISRCSHSPNNHLEDPQWSHDADYDITRWSVVIPDLAPAAGSYLLQVVSGDPSSGSLTTYVLTPAQLQSFIQYMFSSSADYFTQGIADNTAKGLAKTFFDPFQYVVKCLWFPWPANSSVWGTLTSSTIHFAWYDSGISAQKASFGEGSGHEFGADLTLGTYTDWTDRDDRWHQWMGYCPGFGTFNIPAQYTGKRLELRIAVDFLTGAARMFLRDSNHSNLIVMDGKWGLDVQLSSLYQAFIQPTTTVSGLVMGSARGFGAGIIEAGRKLGQLLGSSEDTWENFGKNLKAIGRAGIEGFQNGMQPMMYQVGSNDARYIFLYDSQFRMTEIKYPKVADPTSKIGGTLHEIRQISSIPGYIEIENPKVDIACTLTEKQMIEGYLSSGFWYE